MSGRPAAGARAADGPAADGRAADGPVLAIADLDVRYHGRREPALAGVELTVAPGEIVGVAGRNGAGKSTLALAAAGFVPRVVRARISGRVEIAGRAAIGAPAADLLGRVGIVFSSPSNQLSGSKLTVREELAFGLENLGVPREAMDGRIDETLEALGVAHLAGRLPTALSGGEQQRVAIAAILCMGPGVLVLDEPTAQLDPAGSRAVADLLEGRTAAGTAVLVAEHRAAVLGRADRCLVLDGGRVAGLGPPGVALGPALGGPAGVAVPATAALASALGLPAAAALDAGAVAAAIRGLAPGERAAARRTLAATRSPVPIVGPWEAVREVGPARIEVAGLRHAYPGGAEALRGVDLVIEPGETVAIVGRNGSGKTTLAKHLVRILSPGAGTVRVGGSDLAGRTIAEAARTVGFVFQDPGRQLFGRTVDREAAFGPRNLGLPEADVVRLVDRSLAAVGLAERAGDNPYDLGFSDRKLVALASILAMDPAVLVLDEPTTGQDAPGVARVGAIVDAWAAAGRTVVAITHDMELAARHFGRVVVMHEGLVVADGRPTDVLAAANAPLLASTGLEPPPLATLAALVGIGGVPVRPEDLLATTG